MQTTSIGTDGEIRGLDECKWLTKKESAPTYILIYDGKIALIAVDKDNNPISIIIKER